jgi:thiol:disulfide interchange protein DsbD
MRCLSIVAAGAALLLAVSAQAAGALDRNSRPEFLPVDEAFVLGANLEASPARLFWQMADGYYLYRHRFEFELQQAGDAVLASAQIPDVKKKTDEYFGEVEVYYGAVTVPLVIEGTPAEGATLMVRYQGCADAGLCYPPERRFVSLTGPGAGTIARTAPTPAVPAVVDPGIATNAQAPAPVAERATLAEADADADTGLVTEESRLAALLGGGSLLTALAVFFLAGIGLAFTPCVLPMVPILSSIIAGQGDVTRGRAAVLSGTYVLAMAATYAVLGTIVGFFGGALNLHGWLQSPPVLVTFAGLFAVLSLSMFGFYELQLPAALRDRLESKGGSGGSLGGVAAMGVFSSLLVSPCVSAPLAGALVYISTTGDALLGGSALFVLALGMGVPLMVVGVGGGTLLPRAGVWMTAVKSAFGVLLLGVAVWLLERVIPPGLTLLLWAALAVGSGVALGALDFSPRQGLGNVWKASGAMLFVYGVLLLIGAASGAENPLRPLEAIVRGGGEGGGAVLAGSGRAEFAAVDDLEDVEASLARSVAAGRPVILDLYADWCISCKVMERQVFPEPEVQQLMARFDLLRADVTANDSAHRALLAHYDLFGPPSLLFFSPSDGELRRYRLQGEIDAEDFAAHLRSVLAASG